MIMYIAIVQANFNSIFLSILQGKANKQGKAKYLRKNAKYV